MIYGIGTDIIEIGRFNTPTESFLNKVYTDEEIFMFRAKPSSLAGNFAAKEAVAKALGTGFHGISPKEIEILRSSLGAPFVTLYGNALKLFNEMGCTSAYVSISHSKENACAFAVLEGENKCS